MSGYFTCIWKIPRLYIQELYTHNWELLEKRAFHERRGGGGLQPGMTLFDKRICQLILIHRNQLEGKMLLVYFQFISDIAF